MSDINNPGSNIGTQHNFSTFNNLSNVKYNQDSNREYLGTQLPELKAYLDRTEALDQIRELFLAGRRVVVIFGKSGYGKSALANLYYHRFKNEYEQKGWVRYNLNICKSIVQAFDSHSTEKSGSKNDELYAMLAESEILALKNNPQKRLIVVNDITNWHDIAKYLALFHLENTHFLFTAESAFSEEFWKHQTISIENLPVPLISNEQIQKILERYCETTISSDFAKKLGNNLFLLNLINCQAPKINPRAVQEYFETIFDSTETEAEIVQNILEEADLSAAEVWVLLQIGALPDNDYTADALIKYMITGYEVDELDIRDLQSFEIFEPEQQLFRTTGPYDIATIITDLIEQGWLIELENEQFNMHGQCRSALKTLFKKQENQILDADYLFELSDTLSQAFFTEFSNFILDDVKYENHLNAFISFVPEQPNEIYIQALEKLIVLQERNGQYYAELKLREQHLRLLRKSKSSTNFRLVQTLIDISDCQCRCGKYKEARIHAEESLYLAEASQDISLTGPQSSLGLVLQDLGDYEGAKKLLEKAMLSDEEKYGEDHSRTATGYSNLGGVLHDLGDYEGAKKLLEKAMLSNEKNYGEDHPRTIINYSNLGGVLHDLGDYEEAKTLLEKAALSDEKNFGKDHPTTAVSYSDLGGILHNLGNYEEAKTLLEKAMLSNEKNFGEDHPATARVYSNLGRVLQDNGEYDYAKRMLKKAVFSDEKNLGEHHPTTAISYANLGLALQSTGDYQGAKMLFKKTYKVMVGHFDESHPYILRAKEKLADLKKLMEE